MNFLYILISFKNIFELYEQQILGTVLYKSGTYFDCSRKHIYRSCANYKDVGNLVHCTTIPQTLFIDLLHSDQMSLILDNLTSHTSPYL